MADQRDRASIEREHIADERERVAELRDRAADRRANEHLDHNHVGVRPVGDQFDRLAAERAGNAADRQRQAERAVRAVGAAPSEIDGDRELAAERRQFVADDRQEQADAREVLADEREALADRRDMYLDELVGAHGDGDGVAAMAVAQVSRDEAAAARAAAALARRVADGDRATRGGVSPLAAAFVTMTRSLLRAETAELAMGDLVHAAVRFVNGCDAASFTAYVDEVATTLASTGLIADEADAAQYRASDGPCLQAIRTLQMVVSVDLAQDGRWPDFVGPALSPPSIRSVMSAPVLDERPAAGPFGSLNSYGLQVNAFDGEDADTAILLTAHLGVLLSLAAMTSDATTRADQLADAVASRDVIGQAKGILMERERLTAGEAFDVLRAASQRLNRKLRDVAEHLATSGEITAGR